MAPLIQLVFPKFELPATVEGIVSKTVMAPRVKDAKADDEKVQATLKRGAERRRRAAARARV